MYVHLGSNITIIRHTQPTRKTEEDPEPNRSFKHTRVLFRLSSSLTTSSSIVATHIISSLYGRGSTQAHACVAYDAQSIKTQVGSYTNTAEGRGTPAVLQQLPTAVETHVHDLVHIRTYYIHTTLLPKPTNMRVYAYHSKPTVHHHIHLVVGLNRVRTHTRI